MCMKLVVFQPLSISWSKKGAIKGDHITVTGKTFERKRSWCWNKKWRNYPSNRASDFTCRWFVDPLRNIAQDGAVIKVGGVDPSVTTSVESHLLRFTKIKPFELIDNGTIKKAMSLSFVTRSSGGPGMPEMLAPTSKIVGRGLGKDVALITDGRFSGATRGLRLVMFLQKQQKVEISP